MNRWQSFIESAPTDRVSQGNRLTHLRDDNRTLRVIWHALEQAQTRIWVSIFTLVPDRVGLGTLDRLTAAARRGCEVLLSCDQVGSFGLREEHVAPLRAAGGRVDFFNPVWPPRRLRGNPAIRNHRKLFIVDDDIAFCGGFNLSEDYAGYDYSDWVFDDTMARVEGPAAHGLADVFRHTWQEVTGEHRPAPFSAVPSQPDGCSIAVLETDPRHGDTRLIDVLTHALDEAQDHCYLATPYFVPPDWLYDALRAAATRGVEVHVLTAGRTDRAVARLAGWHCYGDLLHHGARIYEMFGRVLHSKTLTIDGQLGSIGSYNMDAWTSRHTLDLNVVFANEAVASSLEDEFRANLSDAQEISEADCTQRNAAQRLLHYLTYYTYRRC